MLGQMIWQSTDTLTVWALSSLTVGFLGYHFSAHHLPFISFWQARFASTPPTVVEVVFQKMAGVFWMGILPLVSTIWMPQISLEKLGLSLRNLDQSLFWIGVLAPIILLVNVLNARKPDSWAMYPQMRLQAWTPIFFSLNIVCWTLYLLAYEFLFRGILLQGTLHLGLVAAIALNSSLYALAHLPKGIKETVGAIPLGAVLSYLTWQTQTLWIAFGVHLCLALSNDLLCLYFHPEMQWKKK